MHFLLSVAIDFVVNVIDISCSFKGLENQFSLLSVTYPVLPQKFLLQNFVKSLTLKMNSFNLLFLFSNVTCITYWDWKNFLDFHAGFFKCPPSPVFILVYFEKSRLWRTLMVVSGFMKHFDSLFPSGQKCGFPRRWECNCQVNRVRGRYLV